jgi:hypothetical protein
MMNIPDRYREIILEALTEYEGNGVRSGEEAAEARAAIGSVRHSILTRSNSSGYRGVSYERRQKKWRAQIRVKGRGISLGYFRSALEAAEAYDRAALELHGLRAKLNL